MTSSTNAITAIRRATAEDRSEVLRLARLDDRPVPAGALLLGYVDGELQAAVAITTGTAIADPFRRTAGLVDDLRHRAERVRGAREHRRVRFGRAPRRALALR